jgi:hypothetical protein
LFDPADERSVLDEFDGLLAVDAHCVVAVTEYLHAVVVVTAGAS